MPAIIPIPAFTDNYIWLLREGRHAAVVDPGDAAPVQEYLDREQLTQAQASKRLGITQPRVSEITRGKVELLSLDYLVGLCAKAGIPVNLKLAA